MSASDMSIDPDTYDAQLKVKVSKTLEEFSGFGVDAIDVYKSTPLNYRMRAEFRVWHDGDDFYYVMFNQETKEKYRVDAFPAAAEVINELMPLMIEAVLADQELKRRLFQIDYLASLSGQVVISLLYHRQLTDEWEVAARALREKLRAKGFTVEIIGRAKRQKRIIERDYVVEKLQVFDQVYSYKQMENSFTQPNGLVAQKMLEWAVECTRGSHGDLLELYCGNGNFSIALAQNFRKLLATELAKPSVESAQWNIERNEISNLKIARLSAQEFTEAMKGERVFTRLKQQEIDLQTYDFQTVFVDPPRAGMDEDSVRMIQGYNTIVYISCNPESLKENLDQLSETHKVVKLALFDQFPYTHHREVGVILEKKY